MITIKDLISRTGKWFSARKSLYEPLRKTTSDRISESSAMSRVDSHIDRIEALNVIQHSFEQLVEKLGGINENIDRHIKQNEILIQRMTELPHLLQNFPDSLKNQKAVIDGLIEQLRVQAIKNQQFIETVEKIPAAAEKQTNTLSEMAVQLGACADVDAQLAAGFSKFNSITDKLKDNIDNQTQSINHLNKTFLASDRYLKYILNTQHKRFMWVFVVSLGICTFAIAMLIIVIFLLK